MSDIYIEDMGELDDYEAHALDCPCAECDEGRVLDMLEDRAA